jgi:ABC-2 type transport system ATP-binding protein
MGEPALLSVDSVSKTYLPPRGALRLLVRTAARAPVVALRSVSFSVSPGEVVGLVGPNGAGKTTLVRIIGTLLSPTTGTVSVAGFDALRSPREVRRRIGLMLEGDGGLYARLTGVENLEFFGVMHGLRAAEARCRARALVEESGVADCDKLVFGYSSGMRARLSLARALLTDPPLLILDEPTRSLDPVASATFGSALRTFAAGGGAVLLSSHRLDEVVSFCSRVVVLVDGELRYDAPPGRLATPGEEGVSALAAFLAEESQR